MNVVWRIDSNLLDSLQRYAGQGIPLGGFLRAVVTNDLALAAQLADPQNFLLLGEYALWVHNNLPSHIVGSTAKYDAWIAEKAQERYDMGSE